MHKPGHHDCGHNLLLLPEDGRFGRQGIVADRNDFAEIRFMSREAMIEAGSMRGAQVFLDRTHVAFCNGTDRRIV